MKKKIQITIGLIAIFIIQCSISNAQSLSPKVSPTNGGYYTSGGNSLSWTMGETYTTTLSSANNKLTQGFQQPEVNLSSILNLILFIQGYYIGSGTMAQVLYNEGVDPNPASTNVDTVSVSLVDSASLNVVKTASGVLQTNGAMSVIFPGSVTGHNYYLKLNHRNTLETWSALTIPMSSTVNYNFTTSAAQAYGSNMAYLGGNKWALYTGDLNQDEFIDANDFPLFDADNYNGVAFIYVATDMNGDGFVDANDFPVFDGNNYQGIASIHP